MLAKDSTNQTSDTSGILVPPPLVYFGCLGAGLLANYFRPLPFVKAGLQLPVGLTVVILSFLLAAWAFREFSKSRTSIDHRKPTTRIISSGPFGFSRNPVYLSLTMLVVGIAVAVDSLWVLISVIPAAVVIHFFVILPEESYLERKFGQEYLQYKKKVRRWL